MDSIFKELMRLDWERPGAVQAVTTRALDTLTRPEVVHELLENVSLDPRLL